MSDLLKGTSLKGTLETILVVDDNETVLNSVVAVLENAHFRVLSASSGAKAIKLAQTNEKIHLLLSDVEMSEISGPDLGEALKKARPDMHVMLMSGGAPSGSLLVLNYGWAFLQKSFIASKLVEMVTDVLHSTNRSQLGGQEFDSRKDTKNPNCDQNQHADAHPATSNEPKDRCHQ
jgi:two-component system cell cycle sensor histidine kinase/response regulator CckA